MSTKKPNADELEDVPGPDAADEIDDADVEGHAMLPLDSSSARHLAGARESEIRRSLYKHGLEVEARRPHKRDR